MKKSMKFRIFALISVLLVMTFTVTAFATDIVDTQEKVSAEASPEAVTETEALNKPDMNEQPEPFSARAIELALQGTATGMIMVFAVLALLAIIVSVSKVIFYDIPNRNKENAEAKSNTPEVSTAVEAPVAAPTTAVAETPVQDDGELAAVITAAIAAMIESGDYKNEFVGGFRVVSFKRNNSNSSGRAWNR